MHKSTVLTSSNSWLMTLDIEVLLIAFFVSYRIASKFATLYQIHIYMWILIITIPAWYFTMSILKMYKNITTYSYIKVIIGIAFYSTFSSLYIWAMLYFIKDTMFSMTFYITYVLVNFSLMLTQWIACKAYLERKDYSAESASRAIIVGLPENAEKFKQYINDAKIQIKILGYVEIDGITLQDSDLRLGHIRDLDKIIKEQVADEVIFALPRDYIGEVEKYMLVCEEMGITARVLLDLYDLKIAKTCLSAIGTTPILTYHTVSFNDAQLFLKRTMDIAGALVGITLALIPSIIVAIAIKLESPGSVIFAQDRVGLNGRIFKFYKFRSMYIDAEERKKELMAKNQVKDGMMFKIKDDPRITKIGKFIRKTSIDEIPQFINVLKGDMSLIGTRPPTLDEVCKYKNCHRRRISIKPGITGMWQVSGRSNITDFDEVVKLDTDYIDKWSIWLDILVIFKTFAILFNKRGAF